MAKLLGDAGFVPLAEQALAGRELIVKLWTARRREPPAASAAIQPPPFPRAETHDPLRPVARGAHRARYPLFAGFPAISG
jgi:hypothetical protein